MITLSVVLLLSQSIFAERRGVINPIVPKKLHKKEGETKRETIARLLSKNEDRAERKDRTSAKASILNHATAKAANETWSRLSKKERHKKRKQFKNFEGYWLLDSITYVAVTLVEFFLDECGQPKARFYTGTQKNLREFNLNDEQYSSLPTSNGAVVVDVEVLSDTELRFFTFPIVSEESLRNTFRIQDADNDVAYAVYYDSDIESLGYVDNIPRYIRLPERPDIQLNRLPSETDWTNPVEMFKYMAEYYALLTEPQKAVSLNQTDYIGWADYNELYETMLTTGVTRTAKVSTAFRGGKYIGVWRTQFPEFFPLTTIHTQEQHKFTPCSTITVTGFKGAYAELNGTHFAASFPIQSLTQSTPYPWQENSSREPYVFLIYDSSSIEEEYDPSIHGVAKLEAQHGPITPAINYRDFMAASMDFVIQSFGPGTHTHLSIWRDTGYSVPETFEELQEALANGDVFRSTVRFRTYTANSFELYWNPYIIGNLTFPAFNINDPFGLGFISFDPYFDYDIVRQNYLEPDTVKNIYFTITGPSFPTDPSQAPLTGMLVDQGYTSNGSQVVFTVNDFGTFPDDLVDEFGVHKWMVYHNLYSNKDNGIVDPYASNAFFGGIVDRSLTNGKTVAYLRILDEFFFDNPLFTVGLNPLTFPREGITSKLWGQTIAAWASLIESLNQYNPDRFILDIRNNQGGYPITTAIASLFGGNRPATFEAQGFPGNGERSPLLLPGSGVQTVYGEIPTSTPILDVDQVASAFPNGIVRGTSEQKKEVIILTSTHSSSSGDVFPHNFLGADPEGQVQDLGHNVEARIVGDIDGRLWAGLRYFDPLPINPLSQNLVDAEGVARTATYMEGEGRPMVVDRHGFFVNSTLSTRPNPLLPGWYDQTEWQDIGITPIIETYPLATNANGIATPDIEDRASWRDIWIENAIKN